MPGDNKKREKLYQLLGDLPPRTRIVSAQHISTEQKDNFILEKLLLDINGIEKVPAYLALPKKTKGKIPAILYHHTHGGRYHIGKDELLKSAPYQFKTSYAEDLTQAGYAVLAIDNWVFGERHHQPESQVFKQMLWNGQVFWGMMVYDNLRALDYLISRPEIDNKRIGTLGMSMGSSLAWWLAALDIRIKVCVDICCLTDYQSLIEEKSLDRHGLYYFVPGLLKHFDTASINSLISPRPHFSLTGNLDPLTPQKGIEKIDKILRKVYKQKGHPDTWQLKRYPVGHKETPQMRQDILTFLHKWL